MNTALPFHRAERGDDSAAHCGVESVGPRAVGDDYDYRHAAGRRVLCCVAMAVPGKETGLFSMFIGNLSLMATRKGTSGKKKAKLPRTATGKKADPSLRASVEEEARAGTRERTEEGHLMAGRMPPSRMATGRAVGAARKVDEAIRSYTPVTEDEKLLQQPGPGDDFTRTDPWRVMRIMGEFIEGFDNLAPIEKGVTIFGSARTSCAPVGETPR